MKTQTNKAQSLYHYKTNDRWKWMAGATAATAAGVTASQASTITVTLSGNFLSSSGGNHLNADLTGDGHADVTFKSINNKYTVAYSSGAATARVNINNVFNRARVTFLAGVTGFQATAGAHATFNFGPSAAVFGFIPITFSDPSINGGATTNGMLMVTDTAGPGRTAEVQLDSFTYNTASVPDQGSTLALLAMGAGGVIALRRRRKAA